MVPFSQRQIYARYEYYALMRRKLRENNYNRDHKTVSFTLVAFAPPLLSNEPRRVCCIMRYWSCNVVRPPSVTKLYRRNQHKKYYSMKTHAVENCVYERRENNIHRMLLEGFEFWTLLMPAASRSHIQGLRSPVS